MANPIRHKNIYGGTGVAALTDSSGTVAQVRRLRVGEWSLDVAIERESVTVEGYAYAVGGFDKSQPEAAMYELFGALDALPETGVFGSADRIIALVHAERDRRAA